MYEAALTEAENFERKTGAMIEIARGNHGTIELDPATRTVCKTFRVPDPGEAADLAQREFEFLKRFSKSLDSEPFLSCPEPIRVAREEGKLWMTYCPGATLRDILADSDDTIDSHLDHIALQLSIAIERYVDEFGEPYFDLAPKNVIYQVSTQTLYFVDFSSRRRWRHPSSVDVAFEVSLGIFLGLSMIDTVRPASWRDRTYRSRHKKLTLSLIKAVSSRHNLCVPVIRQVSSDVYSHSGRKGWPKHYPMSMRGIWYGTVGFFLFLLGRNSILNRSQEVRSYEGG